MTTWIPDGCAAIDDFIVELDKCLLMGFANLSPTQQSTLEQMQAIFTGTPLAEPINTAIEMVRNGVFRPEDFRAIAAARAALQGTQYDHLRNAVQSILGRPSSSSTADDEPALDPPPPLLDGTAHWLTGIALNGFSRLETNTLATFDTSLAQLQSDPTMLPLAALLTGFVDELAGAVPVIDAASIFRWGDLWSKALLMTAHSLEAQPSQPVSGTFYPMGIEWRSQKSLVSTVFYGILKTEPMAYWSRFTLSAYKVDAIQSDEAWLLFPQVESLLAALDEGKSVLLDGIPMLATGDLLWDDDCIQVGEKCNLFDVALHYLAPHSPERIHIPLVLPHKRHPVHLAESVALANYRLEDTTITSGDLNLPLDLRRILNTELNPKYLAKYDHMVGLLRYDDQQWQLQPLAAGNRKQISTILDIGETLKMLRKPPDNSTVAILHERATRLLRER